jgi:hypothetical protein
MTESVLIGWCDQPLNPVKYKLPYQNSQIHPRNYPHTQERRKLEKTQHRAIQSEFEPVGPTPAQESPLIHSGVNYVLGGGWALVCRKPTNSIQL